MYNFYYRHLKELYKEDIQLLYTDTDSLLFNVKTENVYEDMKLNKKVYDFSNYPENHELYSIKHKAAVGRFKDETAGNPIYEFVGLRPKMYSFITANDQKEYKKAKGVTKAVVADVIKHKQYVECLQNSTLMKHPMRHIRSDHDHLGIYDLKKISLSPLDTKRFINKDGITSLPFGHRDIPNQTNDVDEQCDAEIKEI